MPRAITDEERIDRYISTAPKELLIRLQSEVNAALKYRFFDGTMPVPPAPARRQYTRRNGTTKDAAQMPLSKGASDA